MLMQLPTNRPSVLVACEFSGVVRSAFAARGWFAVSCDLLPTERWCGPNERHHTGDVIPLLALPWALCIAHPPCTYLTVSANGAFLGDNGWTKNKTKRGPWRWDEVAAAVAFARMFIDGAETAHIPKRVTENPIGMLSSRVREPDQIIQPWQFGHPETKATCLWLHGVPKLRGTKNVHHHMLTLPANIRHATHHARPGPNRWKVRSTTFEGIGGAMADQWGNPFTL